MKGLYLFQCYLPFIDTVLVLLYRQSDFSPIFLCSFFLGSNGGKFDGNYVLEANVCEWRFVKSTHPCTDTTEKKLILCPESMVVGLAASESKFKFNRSLPV